MNNEQREIERILKEFRNTLELLTRIKFDSVYGRDTIEFYSVDLETLSIEYTYNLEEEHLDIEVNSALSSRRINLEELVLVGEVLNDKAVIDIVFDKNLIEFEILKDLLEIEYSE